MTPKVIQRAPTSTPPNETVALGVSKKVVKPLINKAKKPLTPRQVKAVTEVGKGGSKANALRKAGYSEAIVKTPAKVFDKPNVAVEVDKLLERKRKLRDRIIARMEKTVSNAGFGTASMALRSLNHDIFLLEGKATERVSTPLSEEEMKSIQDLINRNTK